MNRYLPSCWNDIDLDDPFFDTLRADYPGFEAWATRNHDRPVLVARSHAIDALLSMVEQGDRLKITTFKVARESVGLGAEGFDIIDKAQATVQPREAFFTVFPHHQGMIDLAVSRGFMLRKVLENGEMEYFRKAV